MCYSLAMKTKTWRWVLILAAFVLVCAAFQRPASAFAEPCPPHYTGPASIQFGCCFNLKGGTATLQYYTYFCVNGVPENSMRICSATPCH
jgi:hypothetical protein